jgi:uncharacterized protein
MGLIRLITFLLVGWIAWTMYRRFMAAANSKSRRERLPDKHFVRCSYCDVHLPEQNAVTDGKTWFCSKAHQQAWLEKS